MNEKRKKVGLALGSGGIRGLAHVGVIKKLIENDIPIDFIAGSSIGSWVGAHYALFQDIKKLEEYTLGKKKEKFLTFLEPTINGAFSKGEKLTKLLEQWLDDAEFKNTKIPLAIVATDLITGKTVIFKKGKLVPAIRASMCIPTIFTPIKIGKNLLVDGGLSDPVPDELLRKMGADIVISVNLDNYIKNEKFNANLKFGLSRTALRSLNILRYHLARHSTASSDIIIEPYTPAVGIKSFRDYFTNKNGQQLIKNGEKETAKVIEKIKILLKN
ncbi:MAG: patatin-like phospholipase family protein [Patescibacteria group bacterium]